MKCILIISAVVFFSAAGFRKSNELSMKKREIEEIIDLLEEIGRKINYCESTLETIVSEYSAGKESIFSAKLAAYAKETDFPDAWRLAFKESGSLLSDKEKSVFISIGEKLGTSDGQSQVKLIAYMISHFEKELKRAEKNENEKKRLYIVGGIAAGLTAAVLMI